MKKDKRPPPSTDNSILLYFHCANCLKDKPADQSPMEWARTQAGWTKIGLQVWCNRCEANIVHIDFEGQKHPANTLATDLAFTTLNE